MRLVSVSERPVIGISTGEVFNLERPKDPWSYAQNHFYTQAVEKAGGAPMLIPSMDNISALEALYEVMDGILLAGGNDINPELYGEAARPTIEGVSKKRDLSEQYLIKRAEADKKPMLAICRGAQLWNVVKGGSLYQHWPDNIATQIDHINTGKELKDRLHKVIIKETSALGGILLPTPDATAVIVDSHHHQAINKLGRDLSTVAWAEDEIIEAIETEIEGWFAIGVQWHPESMYEEFKGLFEEFVGASANLKRPIVKLGMTVQS